MIRIHTVRCPSHLHPPSLHPFMPLRIPPTREIAESGSPARSSSRPRGPGTIARTCYTDCTVL